jgi:hypothetical protein
MQFPYSIGRQQFYGKGPHSLLMAGSRPALGIITITGRPNHLNYCVIFVLGTEFTNMAAGSIMQPADRDWRPMPYTISRTTAEKKNPDLSVSLRQTALGRTTSTFFKIHHFD